MLKSIGLYGSWAESLEYALFVVKWTEMGLKTISSSLVAKCAPIELFDSKDPIDETIWFTVDDEEAVFDIS